jgi:hypothetical protein
MSRIAKAYDARFRELLLRAGTRRLNQGVEWLFRKAKQLAQGQGVSVYEAFTNSTASSASSTSKCSLRAA